MMTVVTVYQRMHGGVEAIPGILENLQICSLIMDSFLTRPVSGNLVSNTMSPKERSFSDEVKKYIPSPL